MQYVRSLSGVKQNEPELSGQKAKDLALLKENRFRLPDSFVVLSNAFDLLVDQNNLKYKIDYILKHVNSNSPQSYVNAYTSVRKTIKSAKMPEDVETEMKELFEGLTAEGIGLRESKGTSVRIILSPNMLLDPENNDTIVQNIQGYEEFQIAVREAWALAYHPNQLKPRMDAGYPEKNLKIAMVVQVMNNPTACCHAYSALPDAQDKLFLQTYYGHLDLRNKVKKDYFALARNGLKIVSSEVKGQPEILEFDDNGELCVVPFTSKTKHDKVIDRDLLEIARQTKKAERVLQSPVKLFFTINNERFILLWANRLGFALKHPAAQEEPEVEEIIEETTEYIVEPEEAQPVTTGVEVETDYIEVPAEPEEVSEETEPAEEESVAPAPGTSKAVLAASLKLATTLVESKYAQHFEGKDRLGRMIKKLNEKKAFSRIVDREILALANRFVHEDGFELTPEQQAKAVEEVSYILSQG